MLMPPSVQFGGLDFHPFPDIAKQELQREFWTVGRDSVETSASTQSSRRAETRFRGEKVTARRSLALPQPHLPLGRKIRIALAPVFGEHPLMLVLARALSATVNGIEAFPVEVEVNCGWGDTMITIVGLPDAAVKRTEL